jgi:NlpC/P60 family/Bacterial dipeptidyl-peptidase Sh3 domain
VRDPRIAAVNARVVAAPLAPQFPGLKPVTGQARRIDLPIVDLRQDPAGPRRRQLLFGAEVRLFEERAGWAFVQAGRDGHVGYVPCEALAPALAATHWVCAPATHIYGGADVRSPDCMSLSFGSRIGALSEKGGFFEIAGGYVPSVHLRPVGHPMRDAVKVAGLFLGTPYLWGGNSRFGIDCSGLVQAALLACGRDCPGDSDQQQQALGAALPPGSDPRRGDLLFWKGHVALVVDDRTLIHANGFTMSVAFEAIGAATARIADQGEGPVLAHRRP